MTAEHQARLDLLIATDQTCWWLDPRRCTEHLEACKRAVSAERWARLRPVN